MTFASFDELFHAYKRQLHHFVDIKVRGNNVIERIYAEYMPVPFLFAPDRRLHRKGKDYNNGGARYNTNYIQGVGIGSMTDSLAAVKSLVFEEKSSR